jgi:hypothetical protein
MTRRKINFKLYTPRIERFWTAEEAAPAAHVDPQTYRRWKLGKQVPHISSLCLAYQTSNKTPDLINMENTMETTIDIFGHCTSQEQRKVFVCYCQKDKRWLEHLCIQLAPIEHEGVLEIWSDTKIELGEIWKEQIQEAIDSSQAAIILVSAHLLASKFIVEYELPRLLEQAASGGTQIIPVLVSYCLFKSSRLSQFQAVNPPDRPLIAMGTAERDQTLMKVAEGLYKRLELN